MGALVHKDVQVDETGENAVRDLIRELNRQIRHVAQVVTSNFRNPIAIPVAVHRNTAVWAPREAFDIYSFDFYCTGGCTLNAITDGGVGIPMTPAGPWVVAAATHLNVPCTTPYRVNSGQDVSFGFSVLPVGQDLIASINVRRLG